MRCGGGRDALQAPVSGGAQPAKLEWALVATISDWIEGARPRTLPAALAPVILGTASAHALGEASIGRAVLAGGVALALQIGVNFANDYSDGVRGTDDFRTGPPRLTGGGKTSPRRVKAAAFGSFGLAGALGLALVAITGQWWLLALGALAVVAAWFYTGGARPYGYMGLGEVFVFVFFGLMATLGTTYTQTGRVDGATWLGAIGIGIIACALLMVNNIRDIPTDTAVGKKTLAVRLGDANARRAFTAMLVLPPVLGAASAIWYPAAVAALLLIPVGLWVARPVRKGAVGLDLIPVLRNTGLYELVFAIFLGALLAL